MGHIFVSYSYEDKAYVFRLQEALQHEGFDVWVDDRNEYGTKRISVVQKQLDECDAFIVIVSKSSYNSKLVQNEVARADRKKKPFFPLLLADDPWLSVEATQYVDVTDNSLPTDRFFNRLSQITPRNKKAKAISKIPPPLQHEKYPKTTTSDSNTSSVISFGIISVLVIVCLGVLVVFFMSSGWSINPGVEITNAQWFRCVDVLSEQEMALVKEDDLSINQYPNDANCMVFSVQNSTDYIADVDTEQLWPLYRDQEPNACGGGGGSRNPPQLMPHSEGTYICRDSIWDITKLHVYITLYINGNNNNPRQIDLYKAIQ